MSTSMGFPVYGSSRWTPLIHRRLGARLGYFTYFPRECGAAGRRPTIPLHFFSHLGSHPADFEAVWTLGQSLPEAAPGTLEFFLLERYCLYAAHGEHLYRARIHHRPWPLCKATLLKFSSTMLPAHRLSVPEEAPLLYGQAEPLR